MATVTNLLDLEPEGLISWCGELGEKPFRSKQLQRWIHQFGESDFDAMTDLAKSLREKLKTHAVIRAPQIISDNTSADGTRKWLLDVGNGNAVETVFIPEENRGTLCVSTQAGCAVNCRFCSTGTQGFSRNLTKGIPAGPKGERQITNVVMMGMGEPLLNYEPTVAALKLMLDDNAYGLSRRRVTVSTSGVVPMIDKLSGDCAVALAVSLHASNDKLRDELVPLNKKYPLKELLAACKRYLDYLRILHARRRQRHRRACARAAGAGRRRAVQIQPDPVQSLPRVWPEALEQSAHQGFRAGSDGWRHRDHHPQDPWR